ncbi:MAG: hypothetical protein AB1467_00010 [Candidatus Diapherotrites archaeon]
MVARTCKGCFYFTESQSGRAHRKEENRNWCRLKEEYTFTSLACDKGKW